MRIPSLLLLLLLSPLLLCAQQRTPKQRPFALTHITVIAATGAPARRDMTIIIAGGRVAEVGSSKKIRIPQGARIIDATGKFLIPGLWDMHVHLGDEEFDKNFYLRLFIANGITGIRIMEGAPEYHLWRKEAASGTLLT